MDGYQFCGLAENLQTEDLRRNPMSRWWVEGSLTTINRDAIRGVVTQAMLAWASVANVAASEAPSVDQADLLIRIATIDGRQGVLADCMLPGPRVQLMRLDNSESWVVHLGSDVASSMIDLYRVMVHELGHYWGLGHAPSNSGALMAPTYSRSVWTAQRWDVVEMVKLYGAPVPVPTTPTAGSVASRMDIVDQYGKLMARYKIERVD